MSHSNNNSPRRGRISKVFKNNLNGKFKKLVQHIIADPELDMQLRDNYFNVYYEGGCILKLSPSSWSFDKYYYFPEVISEYNKPGKEIAKTYVEESYKDKPNRRKKIPEGYFYPDRITANEIIGKLIARRNKILSKLDDGDYEGYFREAKSVVGKFVEIFNRKERCDQHHIAIDNRSITPNNDLVVIDLEFAVSTKKPYNKTTTKGNPKVPKIDIIAVDKEGQLYAIELKSNLEADATDSPQNVKAHFEDFNNSIGSLDESNDFPAEMAEVVAQKIELNILPHDIRVNGKLPKFAIAFAGSEENVPAFREAHQDLTLINVGKGKRYLTFNK